MAKHGVDFVDVAGVFDDRAIWIRPDTRRDYGEARSRAVGMLAGELLAVVYTERSSRRRLISARRASRNERRGYYEVHLRSR